LSSKNKKIFSFQKKEEEEDEEEEEEEHTLATNSGK
jgi:hypothetical protein